MYKSKYLVKHKVSPKLPLKRNIYLFAFFIFLIVEKRFFDKLVKALDPSRNLPKDDNKNKIHYYIGTTNFCTKIIFSVYLKNLPAQLI
jgi:hypothetical protein